MSRPLTPNTTLFGGKSKSAGSAVSAATGDALLPSQKAVDFLTRGTPAQQRIQEFGRLTPIGSGSATFGARRSKKDSF